MIKINELKLSINESVTTDKEKQSLINKIEKKYRIRSTEIQEFRILKKALDARKEIYYVYNVALSLSNESKYVNTSGIQVYKPKVYCFPQKGNLLLNHRPLLIGFGPASMFCGLVLAQNGYNPIILEKGESIIERTKKYQQFLEGGSFEPNSSCLFGEGGAGTFSDGKLNTLVSDIRSSFVLSTFVQFGANPSILYDNKPHIGTDGLKKVVPGIRKEIERLGGTILFSNEVVDIKKKSQGFQVKTDCGNIFDTDICIVGVGHSALPTLQIFNSLGAKFTPKPFSVGLRIEHPQKMINDVQYHRSLEKLPSADYKLFYHHPNGRTCYTFCMCPGGSVMASNGEFGRVVTNGMSTSLRNLENANSALLVNVTPEDYPSDHPFAGFLFQEDLEKKAFILGGSNYYAPVQTVKDFLNSQTSISLGKVKPTYQPGYKLTNLNEILPSFVKQTLKDSLLEFNRKIPGFSMDDAILTGVETRSSSPVRMDRNEYFESNLSGIYPIGEGSGYSGGIMSSAIDGMKAAEQIILKYKGVQE